MDNIEKLKEKVENDPKSTLFVPLAEEYKKAGQLDDAIDVLKTGIERQPGYMSARVSLGKVYLEKDMKREAREEFVKVVKAIPDNLFALKKLAEIAREMRDREEAIRHYKKLLSLNSMDEESQEILQLLLSGGGIEEPPSEEPEEAGVVEILEDEEFEPLGATLEELEAQAPKRAVQQPTPPQEEDFITSLADKDILKEQRPGAVEPPAPQDAGAEVFELNEEDPGFGGIELSGDEDLSLNEGAPKFAAPPGRALQDDIDSMFGDTMEDPPPEEAQAPVAATKEKKASSPSPRPQEESTEVLQAVGKQAEPLDVSRADACIAEGDYIGAMDVYRKLLTVNPRDIEVLQKAEELKSLLKLLGKEHDIVVARLDAFLDSLKKKRDEFFGNS